MIISITGAPGSGKSFLAKQLSSYMNLPVILEGEEGVIPRKVFEDVFSGGSPLKRWKYFLDMHNEIFRNGEIISKSGVNCIIDINSKMGLCLLEYEKEEYREEIKNLIDDMYKPIECDLIILLKVSKEKLREQINNRSRETEIDNPDMVLRSIHIQDMLIKFLGDMPNTIILERDNIDFKNEKDLKELVNDLKKWL